MIKNKSKGLIWFFMTMCCLSNVIICNGQEQLKPNVIPPSPTAASLMKFAEIPVGYYTGIPNINVPIWKAKCGSLELDISLSYHASSVKVSDTPGWVGLGWALNAGGVISRTMQGLPDEKDYELGLSDVNLLASYYEGPGIGYFQVGKYFQYGDILNDLVSDSKTRDLIKLAFSRGNIDCEPDLFSFNFCGRSGKFVFDVDVNGNRTVRIMPHQDLKIEEKIVKSNLVGFTVTDELGNKYYFDEIERSLSNSGSHDSSWCLSKIVSATKKDSIDFVYKDNTIDYGYTESQKHYQVLWTSQKGQGYDGSMEKDLEEYGSRMMVSTKKLSEIHTANERIVFNASGGRKDVNEGAFKLDDIEIYRKGEDVPVKKYGLQYNYFVSSWNAAEGGLCARDEKGYRLKLDKLTEIGTDGKPLPSYSFDYNESSPLPRRNSFQQDWWGFFNGKTGNDSWKYVSGVGYEPVGYFVPKQTFIYAEVLYELDGASRVASESISTLESGLLKSIKYPTGGKVEFEYEPNKTYFKGVLPPEESEKIEGGKVFYFEGLGNLGTFEVEESAKLFKFTFSDITPTTHITFRRQADGKIFDFSNFESGTGSWSGMLDIGIYEVSVDDPGVEPELISNRYNIKGEYSTYSYADPKIITKKKIISGGVRIKRISNYSNDITKFGVREFYYTKKADPEASSGTLVGGFPTFSHRMSEVTAAPLSGSGLAYYAQKDMDYHVRSSSPCNYVVYTQGSCIGYSEVEVKQLGSGTGKENGSTRYYYSVNNVNASSLHYPFPLPVNTEYKRGKLLKEEHYNAKKDLVQKKEYNYLWKTSSYKKINGLKIKADRMCNKIEDFIQSGLHSDWYNFNSVDYFLQSDYVPLIETIETSYFNGDSTRVITNINYRSPALMNWKKTNNSLGEWLQTNYYYPEDAEALGLRTQVTDSLQSMHMITSVIREEQKNLSLNKVINGKQTIYDFIKKSSNNGIVPREVAQFENGSYHSKLVFDHYTNEGRIAQMHKVGDEPSAFIWGYNSQYPIAKVINAAYTEVYHENFEEPGMTGVVAGGQTGNFSCSGDYSLNFSKPAGKMYVYSYWYYQNSKWIYSGELTYTGPLVLNAGEKIDNVRVYPKNANMETYTYDTSLGMTSHTDANGVCTFYKYDEFGRLRLVQDMNKNILKRIEYHFKGQL